MTVSNYFDIISLLEDIYIDNWLKLTIQNGSNYQYIKYIIFIFEFLEIFYLWLILIVLRLYKFIINIIIFYGYYKGFSWKIIYIFLFNKIWIGGKEILEGNKDR